MDMDNNLYNEIITLSKEGDDFIEKDEYQMAIKKYKVALDLIPSPKYEWEASTWLYTALGDAFYLNSQYLEGVNYLSEALKCPEGLENPFILMRLGECFYELNNLTKAKEYLLQAYMYEGDEIFEDEELKYTQLINDLI